MSVTLITSPSKISTVMWSQYPARASSKEMTVIGTTDRTGTEVVFKPDPEMFDDTVYDYETLHRRIPPP